jgi:hypothetical protein
MSHGNATENDLIKFIGNGVAMPSYGANLQVNFHTADPGETGTATTNEPTWTGYAAVAVARDNTGWTICDPDSPYAANANGSAMKNAAEITFPECTAGGPESMTHTSISVVATGQIIVKGALTSPILVSPNQTPRFPPGTLVYKID